MAALLASCDTPKTLYKFPMLAVRFCRGEVDEVIFRELRRAYVVARAIQHLFMLSLRLMRAKSRKVPNAGSGRRVMHEYDACDVLTNYLAALNSLQDGPIRDAGKLSHPKDLIKSV